MVTRNNSVDTRPVIVVGIPSGVTEFQAALPSGVPSTVDTAPAAWSSVSWLIVLIKSGYRRASRIEAQRDVGGTVTFAEYDAVTPPGTFDVTIAAGGGFGGITLVLTPSSVGWSVTGLRRHYP
jgi:hypothetical protein